VTRLQWIFDPPSPADEDGGGDAAQQVFVNDLDTLTRESLQNCIDRHLDNTDPTRVTFTFFELDGDDRDRFLHALHWPTLEAHLQGMVEAKWLSSARVEERLAKFAAAPLRLLRITDSNTEGLTGGEFEKKRNFKSLCRDILVRQDESGTAGGAFGLGKSVYWAFSGFGTVLFHSHLSQPEHQGTFRLFGRSNLASHETSPGNKWRGPGFFGEPGASPNADVEIAHSSWDCPSHLLQDLWLERSESSIQADAPTGTSILIIDFSEPVKPTEERADTDRNLDDVAHSLDHSVAMWFWPSLVDRRLEVDVAIRRSDGTSDVRRIDHSAVDRFPEFGPFVQAYRASPSEFVEDFTADDQTAGTDLIITVPERKAGLTGPAHKKCEARAGLRLHTDHNTFDQAGKIALMRGARMVVQYMSVPSQLDLDHSVYGVLRAGLAHPEETEEQRLLEEFLRATEPPAHNRWTHTTERARADYPNGSWASLKGLVDELKKFVRDKTTPPAPPGGHGPAELAKLFRNGRVGVMPIKGKLTFSELDSSFDDGVWTFAGSVSYSRPVSEWVVSLTPVLDMEGGDGEPLLPESASIDGATVPIPKDATSVIAMVTGPGGSAPDQLRFVISTKADDEMTGLVSRSRALVRAQLVSSKPARAAGSTAKKAGS